MTSSFINLIERIQEYMLKEGEKSTDRYREAVEQSRKRCREAEEKSTKGSVEAEMTSAKSAKRCRGPESSVVKQFRERIREHRVNVAVRIGSEHFDVRLLPSLKESSYFRRRVETMLTSSAMSNGCLPVLVLYAPLRVGAAACTEAEKNNNGSNEYRHVTRADDGYDQNDFPKTDSNFDEEDQTAVKSVFQSPEFLRECSESLYKVFLEQLARPIPRLISPSCCFTRFSENITRAIPLPISPSCSFSCFSNMAKSHPMAIVEPVYRSIVFQNYGLYDDTSRPIHLCQHYSTSGLPMKAWEHYSISLLPSWLPVEGFAILCRYHRDRGPQIAGLINHLRNLLDDLSRRAFLVTYLARLILPNKSKIEHVSVVCFDFLCALLVEATELWRDLDDEAPASALEEEIEWMEVLVGQFFDTGYTDEIPGPYSGPTLYSGTHRIQSVLAKFSFSTMLSIVTHLRAITNEERLAGVAKIFDTCFTEKLEENSFTVQQVLQIYEEFPNNGRPSHDKIFQVFEESLAKQAMRPDEIHQLAKLLDYNKLSNDIVERLCRDFGLGWNRLEPRFQDRVVKMQQAKEAKAQGELRKKSSYQHIVRLTTKLRVARSDLQKEKETTSCRICFVNPRDTLVLPCRHFHYCRQCLQKHGQLSRTCPTCRGVMGSTMNCIT